jgi:hypothetical protein
MRVLSTLLFLGLGLVASTAPRVAAAEGKGPARAKAAKPAAKAVARGKRPSKPTPTEADAEPATDAAQEEAPKPTTDGESKVKAAGSASAAEAGAAKAPVAEKEGPEGVKTYKFGAIEVEGRLKSPQLIYFLRRVRAEFNAGALGHRSFLGELSDTRNTSAFR